MLQFPYYSPQLGKRATVGIKLVNVNKVLVTVEIKDANKNIYFLLLKWSINNLI